ncbi:phosphatase PAP2 family protein [Streptacidiphilus sp. N1-12]|uniref:Phosphatase PAP2 family protein n=2 Tax=Streptacidiphilus alkalitolerans TaxID=3342712 RepID=A0ABV6WLA6_9ACTN
MTVPTVQPSSARRTGRWQLELLLLGFLYLAYDGSRLLVGSGFDDAVSDARSLFDTEQWLHLDPERWLNSTFSSHLWLGVPADFAYATLHYLVTPAVLVWLWRRHHGQYRRARTWLAVTTVMALVGFILFPAAPPRLMPAAYGFTDTMAQHAAIGWWGGSASAPKGLGSMTNEFAAMPSLHVAWALWCGLMLFRFSGDRTVRTLGLLYPVAITLVVLGTGNHYLFDCLAGALLLGLGALLARPLLRFTDRLRARLLFLRYSPRRLSEHPVPDYGPSASPAPSGSTGSSAASSPSGPSSSSGASVKRHSPVLH